MSQRTIDESTMRRLCVEAECDPRTLRKVLRGAEAKSMSAKRARGALVRAGILQPVLVLLLLCAAGCRAAPKDVYVVVAHCEGPCPWTMQNAVSPTPADVYATQDPNAARGRFTLDAAAWAAFEPDRSRVAAVRARAARIVDGWKPGSSVQIDVTGSAGSRLHLLLYTAARDRARISVQ